MGKQRLEELLAAYRELNGAEHQELERGIAEYPDYVTRLATYRHLDQALQQAGNQNIHKLQREQTRLQAIYTYVTQQGEQSQVGWWAALAAQLTASPHYLQYVIVVIAFLLLIPFAFGLIRRSQQLESISTGGAGTITTAPGGAANPPRQEEIAQEPPPGESLPALTISPTLTNDVEVDGFAFGIDAQLFDGAAGAALSATMQLGFTWVRQTVEWQRFQPVMDPATRTPTELDAIEWDDLRALVQAAEARQIKVLATVTHAPDWAREVGFDSAVAGPPADPQSYADFVGAMAGEFCGSALQALEIWHGQNLHYLWGDQSPDPVAYIELLQAAYASIKSACPTMLVISGAPIPAGTNLPYALDDLDYLNAMYNLGLANYADGIGAHHDGYNVPALVRWQEACEAIQQTGQLFNGACDSPHHSWSLRSTLEEYREIMVYNCDESKRIWPTSFGWAVGSSPSNSYVAADNDLNEQATWSVEAFQLMQGWGWVGPAFLHNLNYRIVDAQSREAQWSILQSDYAALPAFEALRAMPKELSPDATPAPLPPPTFVSKCLTQKIP